MRGGGVRRDRDMSNNVIDVVPQTKTRKVRDEEGSRRSESKGGGVGGD